MGSASEIIVEKHRTQSVGHIAPSDTANIQPLVMLAHVKEQLGAKNDKELADMLGVARPTLSKLRHRKISVGAALLLAIHDTSGLSIKELKRLMGDTRRIGGYR